VIEGNHAISHAVQRCRAKVIAASPVAPSSGVVELLARMCADGRMDARYVVVESEQSAMATCAGAAQAGLRAFTATSSHGLLHMHELLHWCAGARLPIVLANVNRVEAPSNVFADQNDSLSQRDTGWIQYYCENSQEVLDTIIQAYKVAERVLMPAMVCLDAFFLSHTSEPVTIPAQGAVDAYLPPFTPEYLLDTDHPHAFGGMLPKDSGMELRARMEKSMRQGLTVAADADAEYGRAFGRHYGLIDTYRTDDARTILVTSGAAAGIARGVVNHYREQGMAVGLARIRLFRPFPAAELRRVLAPAQRVVVFDRNISFGLGGIMASETRAALCNHSPQPQVYSFVGGLGGRDVTADTLQTAIDYAVTHETPGADLLWLGLEDR
jgi:pyruvate/2-oxoacid:ferredoxin oxidoreductase alpha subunit